MVTAGGPRLRELASRRASPAATPAPGQTGASFAAREEALALPALFAAEGARIGVEVVLPDRTPSDRADLVVFHHDERKRPFAVIECKRDGLTNAEFAQAVEQACGNGTWAKFHAAYVGVAAGRTRRFLDFSSDRYGVLERQAATFSAGREVDFDPGISNGPSPRM